MVSRLVLRLVSLLSLGLAVLPLARGPDAGRAAITEAEREALLACLDESWEALHGGGGEAEKGAEGAATLEELRRRVQTAASLEEALRALADLARLAVPWPSPQGQATPEASISSSRTPTWFPARLW
jgi:hypothetical protein